MKTVIEMAREAGLIAQEGYQGTGWFWVENNLEHFVELVRADEREACARLVEPNEEHRRDASWGYIGGAEGVELLDGMAAAIRARSQK